MADSRKYISQQERREHNKRGDLWISIQGKIYNVSDWSNRHPGGEPPLLNLAGQDVTDAFVAHHPPPSLHGNTSTSSSLDITSETTVSPRCPRIIGVSCRSSPKRGFFVSKGHGVFFALCFMAVLFSVSDHGVLRCSSPWVHVGCGGLMGFLWIQSGWLGLDSRHYQIMMTPKLNRFAQILTGNCLAGISIGWWKWNHNAHHIACNILDFDPDLQHRPLFVLSSKFFNSLTSHFYERIMNFDIVARFFVSYQYWTFYPVICFSKLNLFAQSFILLLSKRKVPNRGRASGNTTCSILFESFLDECLCVGPPISNDWFEKQTSGTLDVKCSPWMDWFHGGLQFQVEHHLFPRLPRCHLRKISPLVKELCRRHNFPYNCVSFWKANALTIQTLRNAAFEARNLSNPIPKT